MRSLPPVLFILAAGNLVIGTGAFGLAGILQPISETLGVSVAATGQSMTAYAFSTALLAPLVLLATGRGAAPPEPRAGGGAVR